MQQRQHVNDLTEKCKRLEYLIESLQQEKILLQDANQKLNDKTMDLHR